jgi:hypothetical protein
MKNILFAAVVLLAFSGCGGISSTGNFGKKITEDGALTVEEFISAMGDQEAFSGKIKGTVLKVCQTKGCWYTMEMPEGKSMTVVTKDHSFSLPKDASGKTAIAEGKATLIVTSVEQLRQLAEDEGRSPEEIAAITQAVEEIEFEADGVILK